MSLRSYDGKLFVGTFEYTEADGTGFGVLYQFTGAAVTELKRWGRVGRATTIGQMTLYGRRLYYGASGLFGVRPGFGIACYDSVEDGHSIFAINDDVTTNPDTSGIGTSWCVDDVVVFGGKMFCYVRGYGAFFTEDSFKDVEQNRAQFTTSTLGGTITSSLYDGGTPGLQKMWRRVSVWATPPGGDLDACRVLARCWQDVGRVPGGERAADERYVRLLSEQHPRLVVHVAGDAEDDEEAVGPACGRCRWRTCRSLSRTGCGRWSSR